MYGHRFITLVYILTPARHQLLVVERPGSTDLCVLGGTLLCMVPIKIYLNRESADVGESNSPRL
jgi:hypothetical protein